MEYNSQREDLIIPEYGRNIQKMIQYAKTIEDKAQRQRFVEKVVDLMQQMNPQSRNLDDYREKLWKHVFRIANYELDVVPPIGKIPTPDEAHKRPDIIPYPQSEPRFRHYGSNVQRLIKKAMSMPAGPKREGFVRVIGSYMKLAYRTWNKEHFVSDDVIKNDLEALSNGMLTLADEAALDQLSQTSRRRTSDSREGRDYRDRDRDYRDRDRDRDRRDYKRGGANGNGRGGYSRGKGGGPRGKRK